MRTRKVPAVARSLAVLIYVASGRARADSGDVLNEIAASADRLCGYVAQSGHKDTESVTGDVKAELSGLARKLANLGLNGTGQITSSEYEGVVQEELAGALKDVRDCKLHIFDVLQKKLLPEAPLAPQQARSPNALYQYGEQVADVQGAVISQSSSTVTFQMVHTAGKADPNRVVEYQDWVLRCPHLPAPPQNTFVGQFSGVVAGERCEIVGKAP